MCQESNLKLYLAVSIGLQTNLAMNERTYLNVLFFGNDFKIRCFWKTFIGRFNGFRNEKVLLVTFVFCRSERRPVNYGELKSLTKKKKKKKFELDTETEKNSLSVLITSRVS